MMNDAAFGGARMGGQQQQQQQQNPLMRIAQLLRNKQVQDALRLDEARAQDAVSALRSVAGGLSGEFQAMASLSPDERAGRVTELRARLERTVDDALSNVLDDSQLRRFREIRLQAKGLQALSDPQVAAALGLTDGQSEQIASVTAQSRQDMQNLMQEARQLGPEEGRKRLTSSRKAALDRTLAVLTPAQQQAWREMIGEQFEMTHEPPAGGPPMGMGGGPGMGRPGGRGPGGMGGPRPGMRGPGMGGPGRGGQRGDDDFDSLDEELF